MDYDDEDDKNFIKKSEQKRIYQRLTENIQNKISNFKEGKSTKNHLNEQLIINICSLCRFLQKRKQEKQKQIDKIKNEKDNLKINNLNNDNLNETILDVFVPYSRLNKTLQMKLDSLNVVDEEDEDGEKLEDNLIANEDEIIEQNSDENINKNLEYLYGNRSMSMSLFNQPFENYEPFEQNNNFLKINNKNDNNNNNNNKNNKDNKDDDYINKKKDEVSKGIITFQEHLKEKVIRTVINEMSYDYISYMLGIFNKLNYYNKNDNSKFSDKKENLTFINIFKNFILELGVSDKKFYEQCVREIIYNKKNFHFNEFLDCFKRLLNLKYEQTFLKYKFLFQITPRKHADFVEESELQRFYDLVGCCKKISDKDLLEKISNFLVSRYKKIFPKDEKLYTRKITMILELFFDIK
jgi:hypothetical protein